MVEQVRARLGVGGVFLFLGLAAVLPASAPAVRAQTACRTANCAPEGTGPDACLNLASPRILDVAMAGSPFIDPPPRFEPMDPKIEPGMCIRWTAFTVSHTSSDGDCPDTDTICNSPSPAACLFETGNTATTDPAVICHYDAATWPAATDDPYYCRIHASPTTGTMRGTLRVTTAISLSVDKSGADILLQWSGGGVAGDVTYRVVRANEKTFAPTDPAFLETDPDGGAVGTQFTDVGENDPARPSRYYFVRNRQAGE